MTETRRENTGGPEASPCRKPGVRLTLEEVSGRTGLPESVLTGYLKICGGVVPSVESGGARFFTEKSVEVFLAIRNLREVRRLDWDGVKEALRSGERMEEVVRVEEKRSAEFEHMDFQIANAARQILAAQEEFARSVNQQLAELRATVDAVARRQKKQRDEINVNLLTLLDRVSELRSGTAYLVKKSRREDGGKDGAR